MTYKFKVTITTASVNALDYSKQEHIYIYKTREDAENNLNALRSRTGIDENGRRIQFNGIEQDYFNHADYIIARSQEFEF